MQGPDWQVTIESTLKEIDRIGRRLPILSQPESQTIGRLRGALEFLARKRKGNSRPPEEHICAMIAAINNLRSGLGFDLPRESQVPPIKRARHRYDEPFQDKT